MDGAGRTARAAGMTPEFGTPRTAIVTGAARRIGRALAEALHADGWHVLVHCNRSLDEAKAWTAGRERYRVVAADLADADAAGAILAACDGWPAPGLLVNNASLFRHDDLLAIDPTLWDEQMAVNLRAPACLTAAFARRVGEGGGGLVVNLLDAKLAFPNPDFLSYTLSKVGLAGLTELTARQLAARRIRVCGIAPSVTLVSGPQSRENFEAVHRRNALGRGVRVEEIVAALRFLVASPTITGEVITLDGGQRFLGLPRDVQFLDDAPSPVSPTSAAAPRASSAAPPSLSILLEEVEVALDIGFHEHEIGAPQRVLVTVEVHVDSAPPTDDPADAWNYDQLYRDVLALARSRRWNLQETLADAIWRAVRARPGVARARVWTRKPDIYPDARAVGVILDG